MARIRWILLALLILMALNPLAAAETGVIEDSAGRTIEVDYPLEQVVVLTTPAAELIRALGALDSIMAVSQTIAGSEEYWPELSQRPVVSGSAMQEPDYEAIVAMQPQAVISYGTHPAVDVQAMADVLEPAGIAVIGIDGYKFDSLHTDTALVGRLFGAADAAQEFTAFMEEIERETIRRRERIHGDDRVSVYAESHSREYRGHGKGSEWQFILDSVGAENMLAGFDQAFLDVDPEMLVQENPDFILKEAPRGLPMGYAQEVSPPVEEVLADLYGRVGWQVLDAVENENLYIISTDLATGPGKFIALLYFGRILYPEHFEDISPAEYLEAYYEEFQGIPFSGFFVYPER